MKIRLLQTTMAFTALPLLCSPALLAADSDKPARPSREELIEKFDTNGDGQLDQAERRAVRAALQANRTDEATPRRGGKGRGRATVDQSARRGQIDTDGDGTISDAERMAAEAAMRERIAGNKKALARVDTDGDGTISDAEWEVARQQLRGRGGRGDGQRRRGSASRRE